MTDKLEVIDFLNNYFDKVKKLLGYHNQFRNELVIKLNSIDRLLNRDSIRDEISKLNKPVSLKGAGSKKLLGRFTWGGSQLIKYNLIIADISLLCDTLKKQNTKLMTTIWN
jgi:hypothetical protein